MPNPLGDYITPPAFGNIGDIKTGLPTLIDDIINLALIVGGFMVLLNLIFAGFGFITATGDPKKMENAWHKIWQSIVGLIIIAASIAIITVFEKLFGIDILTPKITGPGRLP